MADALTVDEQVFGGKWKALKEQMDNKDTGLSRKMNIYTAKLRSLTDEFANDLETTHQIHSVMVEEFNKLQPEILKWVNEAVKIRDSPEIDNQVSISAETHYLHVIINFTHKIDQCLLWVQNQGAGLNTLEAGIMLVKASELARKESNFARKQANYATAVASVSILLAFFSIAISGQFDTQLMMVGTAVAFSLTVPFIVYRLTQK